MRAFCGRISATKPCRVGAGLSREVDGKDLRHRHHFVLRGDGARVAHRIHRLEGKIASAVDDFDRAIMPRTPDHISPLRLRDHEDAARIAIAWLARRHSKGWRNALEDLLGHWRPQDPKGEWRLDEEAMTMVVVNAGEWLIARGRIPARGGLREINAYLVGPDGPYLTPGQKAWITQLREQPLRLYRVAEVRRGEALTLLDELDAGAGPQAVHERTATLTAKPGLLMGARIVKLVDVAGGHQEVSGALYPFNGSSRHQCAGASAACMPMA